MPKVYFAFLSGCARSMAQFGWLIEYFQQNDWERINDISSADLVLVGTCGYANFNEERSVESLKILLEKINNNSITVATGCLAGINKKRLEDNFNITAIAPKDINEIDNIISAQVPLRLIKQPTSLQYENNIRHIFSLPDCLRIQFNLLRKFPDKLRLQFSRWACEKKPQQDPYPSPSLTILAGRGCLGNCSYCAIKFAHGTQHSRPIEDILVQIQSGISRGYKQFYLTAGDLGAYGVDIGTNIGELLSELFQIEGDYQIAWDDFGPNWLIQHFDKLETVFGNNVHKLRHVGFPVQSGSDRILKLMNREYSIDQATECLYWLRKNFPDLDLRTHFLAGFPSESEEDFQDSIEVARKVEFSKMEVYQYSDREGTEAEKMSPKIPKKIITRRMRRFHQEFPGGAYLRAS